MSRARMLVLVLGPFPILAASFALSKWLRPEPSIPMNGNQVVIQAAVSEGEANRPEGNNRAFKSRGDRRLLADCRETAARLTGRLDESCAVIVRAPFVIAGDQREKELESWYRRTIGPAAEALANCYFSVAPNRPITVLLWSDKTAYEHYARHLFGDRGVSIFGYYKPERRTLIMNIATGGGTLVHELTHALLAFDFPEVPDWFNEGLASLHEQCHIRDDRSGIEGLINWRLEVLQKAIRQDAVKPLRALIREDDFRGRDEGLHYAQARYLCMYLQQRGVLAAYYAKFRAARHDDPNGDETLLAVLPEMDWDELDQDFRRWVMQLEPR